LFKTFSYVCFAVQWLYSTRKLHIATVVYVSFLLPDCFTRISGQDNQRHRTRGLTKIGHTTWTTADNTSRFCILITIYFLITYFISKFFVPLMKHET